MDHWTLKRSAGLTQSQQELNFIMDEPVALGLSQPKKKVPQATRFQKPLKSVSHFTWH